MDAFPRFDLGGRTALVTGASRGLGEAIALPRAHAGADVALGHEATAGETIAARIEAMGRRVVRVPMDMLDLDEVRAPAAAIGAAFGRLDILVNDAVVAGRWTAR